MERFGQPHEPAFDLRRPAALMMIPENACGGSSDALTCGLFDGAATAGQTSASRRISMGIERVCYYPAGDIGDH